MRINDLFTIIAKDKTLSAEKQILYTTIRAILKSRKTLGLRNDVARLYLAREKVKDIFSEIFEDIDIHMDLIFEIPQVYKYLQDKGVVDDSSDDETTESESESDTETESTESEDDTKIINASNTSHDDVTINVDVAMPFSWVLTITMITSIVNMLMIGNLVANQCR